MSATCPACAEPTLEGASFCEACGAELVAVPTGSTTGGGRSCVDCGASGNHIADGYCGVCGHKQPGPRDHVIIDLGSVAGVTDRGRRHHRNEDAMALSVVNGSAVVVVCDGVSTTDNPEQASQAAADAALEVLVAALLSEDDLGLAMETATAAAQGAVVALPVEAGGEGNPSCTFVAAIAHETAEGTTVTAAWLGDSRAYWLGPQPRLLSTDHSWATAMAASGALSVEEAAADQRAGVITRWLGRDAPTTAPDVISATFDDAGTLLVCSDGLWNYAPDPGDLAQRAAAAGPTLVDRATALTSFANDSGGHDNITVVLASVPRPAAVAGGTGGTP